MQNHLAKARGQEVPAYIYNDVKREHLIRTGSHIYHESYFDSLGGNVIAGRTERRLLRKPFGSFDARETEFRRIGASLGGNSAHPDHGHIRALVSHGLGYGHGRVHRRLRGQRAMGSVGAAVEAALAA